MGKKSPKTTVLKITIISNTLITGLNVTIMHKTSSTFGGGGGGMMVKQL